MKNDTDSRSKFCVTCYNYVKIGKIPSVCLSNGLDFPEVPECFKNASVVEERFCALRIPFMIIKKLGHERQCGLKGQIVNVPIQCETIVSSLPRSIDDTYTIQLHLKRKMEYNHDYMCETFRPNLVLKIFNYLKSTPLYRQYNVCFSEDWRQFEHCSEEERELFIVSESDTSVAAELNLHQSYNQSINNSLLNIDENIGCEDTLLNCTPIESLTLAPGEGQVPLSLLLDPHAEELSFPLVFFGRARELKIKLSYNKIVKSALKHYSRKCNRVDMLFFMYKKLELLNISQRISICLRKKCTKNTAFTASQMLDDSFVDNLIQHDDGFKLLETLPSSPAYWQKEGKEIRAMIRQLGLPTFFITFSAAETKWGELLRILKKIADNEDILLKMPKNCHSLKKRG